MNVIKSRLLVCAGKMACGVENRNAYGFLVVKPTAQRKSGRSGCRWKDSMKTCREGH
jgi:hypothetical protein